eukprot:TRINITY_DN31811_c0_g1_i1.p1 TRINITY_DN31811_c0_g1~~TRINITY_DN31811_c0_g1_i1.p1  ORF type:complete len:1738 (+),score=312.78 TRINITY_DN31811_c0_g1_i1:62-5215(+)
MRIVNSRFNGLPVWEASDAGHAEERRVKLALDRRCSRRRSCLFERDGSIYRHIGLSCRELRFTMSFRFLLGLAVVARFAAAGDGVLRDDQVGPEFVELTFASDAEGSKENLPLKDGEGDTESTVLPYQATPFANRPASVDLSRPPSGISPFNENLALAHRRALLGMSTSSPFFNDTAEERRLQTQAVTEWVDVCVDDSYARYLIDLCPDVFIVSTLAYNPLYPRIESTITIILQPSRSMASVNKVQYVYIQLEEFTPIGEVNEFDAFAVDLILTPNNKVPVGKSPEEAYNNPGNSLFGDKNGGDEQCFTGAETTKTAKFNTLTKTLQLRVCPGYSLAEGVDTEITVCCMRLPKSSVKDNPTYTIWAPTSLGDPVATDQAQHTIRYEPVKNSPYIDAGLQWDFIQVMFEPPISKELTVVILSFRPANLLTDRRRIIFHMPSIVRNEDRCGVGVDGSKVCTGFIDFNTAGSGDGTDWMLFDHKAKWDADAEKLTFFLREGAVLEARQNVTLRTYPGEFRLPIELPANWQNMTLEARSFDNIDEVIRPGPVQQSSRVPHIRKFTYSELVYFSDKYGEKFVKLIFMTNRPMFAGTTVYVRLSGFRATQIELPLINETKYFFQGHVAKYDLPQNLLTLQLNKTLYSDEEPVEVIISYLIVPPALYANDTSLLIKPSDAGALWQPIDVSPEVCPEACMGQCGVGSSSDLCLKRKEFTISQVLFEPMEPRMPANVTFLIRPSIVFYQDDKIILHLYGFLSNSPTIPLIGDHAYKIKNRVGVWDSHMSTLSLIVETNEIIMNTETLIINVGRDANFRLPDKLSKNDGILRIEGEGAFIERETFKKTPQFGDAKYVIDSRITFEPATRNGLLSMQIARISFSLILNCDVLPNSTLYITLGGIQRDIDSSVVLLSGANAPLFVDGLGVWDQYNTMLTVKIIPEIQVYSGERIRFFIEIDQFFRLPYAMDANDPSFLIGVPEAGIATRPFNFSTRVSQNKKRFYTSRLVYCYGTGANVDCTGAARPDTIVELRFYFQTNVVLPAGSQLQLYLPGFGSGVEYMAVTPPYYQLSNEFYVSSIIPDARWNQLDHTLTFEVPKDKEIPRSEYCLMRISMTDGAFKLPQDGLTYNDPRLTVAVVKNQIILPMPIIESPRVVDRTFDISELDYLPPQKESTFQMRIRLRPTVNITKDQPIILSLPGFINVLSKFNIHILGADRDKIRDSMAQWNATTSELTFQAPLETYIPANEELNLIIQESQGFILPASLNANDTRIRVRSVDNVPVEPVKMSPMVGNGPSTGHRFCMYQHERGTRTMQSICAAAATCVPPLTDPCNDEELARCGCNPTSVDVRPMAIRGFNLQEADTISFLPEDQLCGTQQSEILSSFGIPTNISISADRDKAQYYGISSRDTGYFRICVEHEGMTFDVGLVTVRPLCRKPLVMVDGVCVDHCPKTKIPIAGACLRDAVAGEDWDAQALMLPVRIDDVTIAPDSLADSATDDPERKYFIYRYTYELARLLNCDPQRIEIASLSNGSVIANTVFKIVDGAETGQVTTGERSPMGLVSLLRALQRDSSSQLYESNFFKYIDRAYRPEPMHVRKCDDNTYRIFCPYTKSIVSSSLGFAVLCIGCILVTLILFCVCAACWMLDSDRSKGPDEEMLLQAARDHRLLPLEQQIEYANSWLQGRFMNEAWQNAREQSLMDVFQAGKKKKKNTPKAIDGGGEMKAIANS